MTTPDPALRCQHLRTKMMFVTAEWEERAVEYPSTTAAFWCLRTMECVGPDGEPAELESCRAGRSCFEEEA